MPKTHELKDLNVDRVDGVDKPATGRRFLVLKSEETPTGIKVVPDDQGNWHPIRNAGPMGKKMDDMVFSPNADRQMSTYDGEDAFTPDHEDFEEFPDGDDVADRYAATRAMLGDMSVESQDDSPTEPTFSRADSGFVRVGPVAIGSRALGEMKSTDEFVKGKKPGAYDYQEPDKDRRGAADEGFGKVDRKTGMILTEAGAMYPDPSVPGTYRLVQPNLDPKGFMGQPGNVGGVPVTKNESKQRVFKRMSGLFRNIVMGDHSTIPGSSDCGHDR